MRTLKETKCESAVTVVKLHEEKVVKRHIMDMSVTKGMEVYVHRVVLPGDLVEVNVRDYGLSLRKADAGMAEVQQELLFSEGLSQS